MSGPKDGEGGGSRDAADPTGKTVPGMGPPGPSLDRAEPPSPDEAPPSGDTIEGIPAGFAKTVMPQGAVPPPPPTVEAAAAPAIVVSATSPSPAKVQASLPPPSMGRLEPGRILGGRYQVVEYVGAGGFGQVYRGIDATLGREVAIKALHPEVDTAENQQRFENEIKITAKLDPRRVVQVYDLIREPDVGTVQIMEYVPGHDLSDVWQNLPISKRLDVFARICEGVDSGHRLGFIHRDLKPENVRVTAHGDVLVMDWGLGKQFRETALTGSGLTPELVSHLKIRRDLTVAGGGPPGTPGNIAPEAFRGEVIANPRGVDVFALGTMLYEMVTGQHPYADYEHRAPVQNYLSTHPDRIGPPPAFREVVEGEFPDFFYKIEEVARRATEADPARRYQSTQELREAVLMVRARAEFDRIREIRRGMIETEQEMHRAWAEYRVDRQISPEQEDRMHRPIQTLIGKRQEMDQAAENLVTYLTQLTNNERAPEARKMIAELSWLRLVHGGDRMDARVRQMLMDRIHDYDIATPGEPKTSMKDSLDGVLPVEIRGLDRLQGQERTHELRVRVIPIEEYEPGFYREGEPLVAGFLGDLSGHLQFRAGYYVFEVSHPDYGFMRVPAHIKLKHVRRGILEGQPFSLNLDLIPREMVPPGFYLVQGGEATVGLDIHRYEDPSSLISRPQRRMPFHTFAISNVPTKDQYKQFLDSYLDYVNQLMAQGRFPEAAHFLEQVRDWIPRGQAKVPKRDLQGQSDWENLFATAFDGVAYHWKVVQTGQGRERRFRLVDPWGQPGLFEDIIRPNQPIDAIPGNAAEAYTAWFDYQWRRLPDGRLRDDRPQIQLSSHLQNQIIARNSFEWLYPWGYHFRRTNLASRLVHRDVRKDAYLHPRGTHPLGRELYRDFSIYGGVNQRLVDLLGNDRQWTSTPGEDNTLMMFGGSVRSPSGHYFLPTSESYSTRRDWVTECNGGFRMVVEFPPINRQGG